MGIEALLRGVARRRPTAQRDGQRASVRLNKYGGVFSVPEGTKQYAIAEEGSYYVAHTGQTGVAMSPATAFAATNPFVLVAHSCPSTDDPNVPSIYLDRLVMEVSSAGSVSTQALAVALVLDFGNRYLSGGTPAVAVPVNLNAPTQQSVAQVYYGNITATAPTQVAVQVVGMLNLDASNVLLVAGSRYVLNFGTAEQVHTATQVGVGTNVLTYIEIPIPPMVVGPGQSMLAMLWEPGSTVTTPPSLRPHLSWWER